MTRRRPRPRYTLRELARIEADARDNRKDKRAALRTAKETT